MTRPYTRTAVDWSDPASRNEYMRRYQAEWRKRNPERYRAATKRWRFNAKLRECGLSAPVDCWLTRAR
jgi:hypothetical protein